MVNKITTLFYIGAVSTVGYMDQNCYNLILLFVTVLWFTFLSPSFGVVVFGGLVVFINRIREVVFIFFDKSFAYCQKYSVWLRVARGQPFLHTSAIRMAP
jgi:hypothetical protein